MHQRQSCPLRIVKLILSEWECFDSAKASKEKSKTWALYYMMAIATVLTVNSSLYLYFLMKAYSHLHRQKKMIMQVSTYLMAMRCLSTVAKRTYFLYESWQPRSLLLLQIYVQE